MPNHLPQRRSPVHHPPRSDHDRPVVIFLTVCIAGKTPVLANAEAHETLVTAWREANAWLVGRYVVMPDHVHLFCAPESMDTVALPRWVKYWKALVSRKWSTPDPAPVWQRSFWDTQFRRGESYRQKWEYVRHNPVRAGLCAEADAWPYQGEMNVLAWRD